jgi:hypothetical protein
LSISNNNNTDDIQFRLKCFGVFVVRNNEPTLGNAQPRIRRYTRISHRKTVHHVRHIARKSLLCVKPVRLSALPEQIQPAWTVARTSDQERICRVPTVTKNNMKPQTCGRAKIYRSLRFLKTAVHRLYRRHHQRSRQLRRICHSDAMRLHQCLRRQYTLSKTPNPEDSGSPDNSRLCQKHHYRIIRGYHTNKHNLYLCQIASALLHVVGLQQHPLPHSSVPAM